MKIVVTGGAGFIGSALVRHLINDGEHTVWNLDKLTYAGDKASISCVAGSKNYQFSQTDICDRLALDAIFQTFNPDIIINLAAESHVDRSIGAPDDFIQTNILGTYNLLEATRKYWANIPKERQETFRFLHVSTDEVYGDLGEMEGLFTESSSYQPSSPYSASKASSDHLVRSWFRTFGLPTVITNCSNNYGPFQFPEKLIPNIIAKALRGDSLPIYGDGNQIRDWLFVEDHARALTVVATQGSVGETYNIGGKNEKKNIEVVSLLCELLEELSPQKPRGVSNYSDLIEFVDDRPGHDYRYAVDIQKIETQLGWTPQETFETGLRRTVIWYLSNKKWWGKKMMTKNLVCQD